PFTAGICSFVETAVYAAKKILLCGSCHFCRASVYFFLSDPAVATIIRRHTIRFRLEMDRLGVRGPYNIPVLVLLQGHAELLSAGTPENTGQIYLVVYSFFCSTANALHWLPALFRNRIVAYEYPSSFRCLSAAC